MRLTTNSHIWESNLKSSSCWKILCFSDFFHQTIPPRRSIAHARTISQYDYNHLDQIQRKCTRENVVFDVYVTNRPGLVKSCNIVPSIADHHIIVLIKAQRLKKPRRPICTGLKLTGRPSGKRQANSEMTFYKTVSRETSKQTTRHLQTTLMTWSAVTYRGRWIVGHKMCHGWLLPSEGWLIQNNACTAVQRERTRTNIGLRTGHTRTTPPKLYGRLVGITSTACCRPVWMMGTLSRFGSTYLARRTTSQGLRQAPLRRSEEGWNPQPPIQLCIHCRPARGTDHSL